MTPALPPSLSRLLWVLGAMLGLLLAVLSGPASAVDGGRIEPVAGALGFGDLAGLDLVSPIVGVVSTPDAAGYWMTAADGGVFGFGTARFLGSMGGVVLSEPVVGIAATPTGGGYWLVARDGGVFSFGDAGFYGSAGDIELARPITGIAATPTGLGYWMVGDDGGVFAYGDARYWGSTGSVRLNRPIVDMAATPTGLGYWLTAEDGGVFTFGDARYFGSAPADSLNGSFVAMLASPSGYGYGLVQSTGRVLDYGDSIVGQAAECDAGPVVAARPSTPGALLLRRDFEIPKGRATSLSSSLDDQHLRLKLAHRQACSAPRAPAFGEFGLPMDRPLATSPYGSRRHPVWGTTMLHAGVDYIGALATGGAPAFAVGPGTVVEVEERIAYGVDVVIDHGGRIATVYAHLAGTGLAVGDVVARGDTIGVIGDTGFATGAHLHFELRLDGVPVDPTPYLSYVPAAAIAGVL